MWFFVFMLLRLLVVGGTNDKNIQLLVQDYCQRISHYHSFELQALVLKGKMKKDRSKMLEQEARLILDAINPSSLLVLFDEKGKEFSSLSFSKFLQKKFNAGPKEIVFCIGGAYGFSEEVYQRANAIVALSQMTLTHQMVRLLAVEQIYRALTILNGQKYHH